VRIALKHKLDGRTFDFTTKGEALIGSGEDCDVRLDDAGVSPKHARVKISSVGIEVDAIAGSGVVVNSHTGASQYLSANDEIQLGGARLTLVLDPSEEKPGPRCRRCGAQVTRIEGTRESNLDCEHCVGMRGSSRFNRAVVPPVSRGTARTPAPTPIPQDAFNAIEEPPQLNLAGSTARLNVKKMALEELETEYVSLALLGEGSQGRVYKLKNKTTGQLVAAKVLWTGSKRARARFDREIEALKVLGHPSIVGLVDVRENATSIILLMEYVEGTSLAAILKQQGRIEPDQVLRVASAIAEGLAFAASHGIVHRDVKPSNILIGPDGAAKLVDFGLVAFADARTKLTAEGQWIGTPHYMAPEQMSTAEVDSRTDTWGLGVTIYQAATGRLPFESNIPADLFKKILNDPVDLDRLAAVLGEEAAGIVGRCLEKDIARRPAPDKVAALLSSLAGHPG
jgi:predicted Ser/Thr protein kinase